MKKVRWQGHSKEQDFPLKRLLWQLLSHRLHVTSAFHPLLHFPHPCLLLPPFHLLNLTSLTNHNSSIIFSFLFLSLSQSIPWLFCEGISSPRITHLFLKVFFLTFNAVIVSKQREQKKLNSGWMIYSIFTLTCCLLTKTVLIEIQHTALQPAKCSWNLVWCRVQMNTHSDEGNWENEERNQSFLFPLATCPHHQSSSTNGSCFFFLYLLSQSFILFLYIFWLYSCSPFLPFCFFPWFFSNLLQWDLCPFIRSPHWILTSLCVPVISVAVFPHLRLLLPILCSFVNSLKKSCFPGALQSF